MGNYDFIARGLPPIDIASPLLQIEQIRRQRSMEAEQQMRTNMMEQRDQLEQKRYEERTATEKARYEAEQERLRQDREREDRDRTAQDDSKTLSVLRRTPLAKIQQSGAPPPAVAQFLQRYGLDPSMDEQTWNSALSQAELSLAASTGQSIEQPPGELIRKDLGNGYWVMLQDGKPVGGVQSPRDGEKLRDPPAGYRWTADGNQEVIPGGPADKDESSSLNDRQRSGADMQMDAALMYAANSAGVPREEVDRIFAEQGADGVAALMVEKNNRILQGGLARGLEALPGGKAIVDIANSDLIAPKKAGGAGIAMYQNPTGPITNPDFLAGEAQFPQPIYPIETQAELIRQMLKKKEQTASGSSRPAAQPQQEVVVDFYSLPPAGRGRK